MPQLLIKVDIPDGAPRAGSYRGLGIVAQPPQRRPRRLAGRAPGRAKTTNSLAQSKEPEMAGPRHAPRVGCCPSRVAGHRWAEQRTRAYPPSGCHPASHSLALGIGVYVIRDPEIQS